MAKIKKGILGPFSGRVGPIIGGSWKGIGFIRIKPEKPATPKPRSEAQLAHLAKFKYLTLWLKPFHNYLSIGYRNLAEQTTELSAAFSYNFKNALSGVNPNFELNYEEIRLSRGVLPGIENPVVTRLSPSEIQLTWKSSNNPKAQYNDLLMLVVYDRDGCESDGIIGGTKRADHQCVFKYQAHLEGKDLDVFIAMFSVDGKLNSESQYLGRINQFILS